ncbi:MAG: prepilin peptidase [Algiphilus sp.]|uniref:prepilin peptidase n=1 Tax=Algiphilus sp. TaxID=1872431 RepID=UPI0032EBF653
MVALLLIATMTDLRRRRIPNAIPAAIVLLSAALMVAEPAQALSPGWSASALGALFALVTTLPGHAFRALGAGDVKLLAACGVALGWPGTALFVILWLMMLAVLGVALRLLGRGDAYPAAPAMLASAFLLYLLDVLLETRYESLQ